MSAPPNHEETLFEQALRLDSAEARAAYLRDACGEDVALRESLLGLLRAHDRAGQFLEHKPAVPPLGVPPSGGAAQAPAEAGTPNPAPSEKPGDRIGRYKLLEKIGEGGMGVVWMAEQEEPVRRRVALKIIKLGMDTRQVLARFEAERQALALMDHPNIARVFDGGATGTGRPYFVMELVRGLPITKYCDEAKLSTRQRLELFAQVCRAVQHAHQKGIIHRDLKPSNILVTVQDDRPVVKVIDFGIAKATEGRLTDKTLFTGFDQLMGTPAYMSPEQAGLGSLDIDTRSDTYSLGVVLYELLAGRPPFDTKELMKQGYEAVLRTIREVDPPKPSTRLTQELAVATRGRLPRPARHERGEGGGRGDGAGMPPVSPGASSPRPSPPSDGGEGVARASSRRRLQEVRGDLDWIVMKCLEKDRARRYETANGLAQDLERYLHDEPVLARPPSLGYRWRKFARKHHVAVAAGFAFLLLLAAAATISTALALRAERERALARSSEAESRAVLNFLREKVLAAPRPEGQDGGLGYDVTLRAAVDAAEPGIARAFANQPLVEASIRGALGDTYTQLGNHPAAYRQHQRAWELFQAGLGPDHSNTLGAAHAVAENLHEMGDPARAVPLFEQILQRRQVIEGTNSLKALATMAALGSACRAAGQLPRALSLLEQSLSSLRTNFGSDHRTTLGAMNFLAMAYRDAERPGEMVRLFEDVLRVRRESPETKPVHLVHSMNNLTRAYLDSGRTSNAVPLVDEALQLARSKLGPEHPSTLKLMNTRGWLTFMQGRVPEAVGQLEEALQATQARLGTNHPDTAGSMNYLAIARFNNGQSDDAVQLFEEVLRIRRATLGSDHPETFSAMNDLGIVFRQLGRLDRAIPLSEEAWRRATEQHGRDHRTTLYSMNSVILAYAATNRLDAALMLFDTALKLRRAKRTAADGDTHATMKGLAGACLRARRFADAEARLRAVSEEQRKAQPAKEPRLAETLSLLGESLLRQEKYADAQATLRECLTLLEQHQPGVSATFQAQGLLGWALLGLKQFDDAEPLLVRSYEGLKQRAAARPAGTRAQFLGETGERLVQLYEASGKLDQAAEWRARLKGPMQP